MLEGLQDKVRGRRGEEVDEDHLKIGEVLEGGHQGHGLAGTWGGCTPGMGDAH